MNWRIFYMLTTKVTLSMVEQWKEVYEKYRDTLTPNRISGVELDEYLQMKYHVMPLDTPSSKEIVIDNIMNNEPFKEKLPKNTLPKPKTYLLKDSIFIGIDLVTGHFIVEGSPEIFDDLFAYRGLDQNDLKNVYMVYEYIRCTKKDLL